MDLRLTKKLSSITLGVGRVSAVAQHGGAPPRREVADFFDRGKSSLVA